MKTHVSVSGLALLLILAAGCGKDDALPSAPDAAAKDAGATDAVKADGELLSDGAAPADTSGADVVASGLDAASVDVVSKVDDAARPVVADAGLDSAPRLDVGNDSSLRDADLVDVVLFSQADGGTDAPVAAPGVDGGDDSGAGG